MCTTKIKSALLSALLLSAMLSSVASASTLSVFSDVDIWRFLEGAGNQQLALNLLSGGSTVLISSQTGFVGDTSEPLGAFYSARGDVEVTRTAAELTSSALSATDLLILDVQFNLASPYSVLEQAAIAAFLRGGGDVAAFLETNLSARVSDYNALLTAIGSTVRIHSSQRCCGGPHFADTVYPSSLTIGVSQVQIAAANNLLGGHAVLGDQGYTVIVEEVISPIPLPASMLLLAGGTGVLLLLRRSDRDWGSARGKQP